MKKEGLLKLVDDVKNMELNDDNCNEILISFHEIQSKVKDFFPEQIKLQARIQKIMLREYKSFQIQHKIYLEGNCDINRLSPPFSSLKIAIEHDLWFDNF
ncbi:MAG: hypothetical protein IPO63_16195 [Bacteroidetes bacterium]|nr:hypothetical protein [Bacteroidota bacterium]